MVTAKTTVAESETYKLPDSGCILKIIPTGSADQLNTEREIEYVRMTSKFSAEQLERRCHF